MRFKPTSLLRNSLRKIVVKILTGIFSHTLTQVQAVFTLTTCYVPEHIRDATWHFTYMQRHDWRSHSRIIKNIKHPFY